MIKSRGSEMAEKMSLIDKLHKKEIDKFLVKYKDSVDDISELTAGTKPKRIFYLWLKCFGYLLDNDPDKCVSRKGLKRRQRISPLLHKFAPSTLSNTQVFEDRNDLMYRDDLYVPVDGYKKINYSKNISIPSEPVIWVANHAFKDDTLASILAQNRQASIMFGSLPQFYNTMDGLTGWIIGVAMVNRASKQSKHASLKKAEKIIKNGGDIFIFPEGAWNRTPEKLMVDLWPGFYKLAKETGAKVIPISHYMSDCCATGDKNVKIHTVVDDPIRIDDMSEQEAIDLVRDKISTWYYLMMEKYGKSTRNNEVGDSVSSCEIWRGKVLDRIKTVDYYDCDLENRASYIPKNKPRPEDVWAPIIGTNDPNSNYAQRLVLIRKTEDMQNNL